MRYITAIPYLPLYNESIYPMPKSNAERQRDYQRRAAEALRNARTATLPPTPAPEHRLPTLLLTAYELAGGAYDYGDEVEDSPLPDHAPTVARLIYDILASAGFEPIDPDDADSNRRLMQRNPYARAVFHLCGGEGYAWALLEYEGNLRAWKDLPKRKRDRQPEPTVPKVPPVT